MTNLNIDTANQFIEKQWEETIVPELVEYIKIPNKSPAFDPHWETHGYMDNVVTRMVTWVAAQEVQGLHVEVVRLPSRTPLIYIEIEGHLPNTILLYGHLDKQPEMSGWHSGLGPWIPVRKGDRLYGRGGADDGYAIYAAITAIKTLQQQQIAHGRCVVIIEACEESGSVDLPAYVTHLQSRIGKPELVICLDSSAQNYAQMWSTTSLRGLLGGVLSVELLKEGMHSGAVSGIVASTFRIARALLSRVEDPLTGDILLPELHVSIPDERIQQVQHAAEIIGEEFKEGYPLEADAMFLSSDVSQLMINRSWKPTLCVIGVDGIPSVENGGNVLRPKTVLKLSFRLPPTCNAERAGLAVKKALETQVPYHAKVSFTVTEQANGWHAPLLCDWLKAASDEASHAFFGAPTGYVGEGGSIPFMGMLGKKFQQAQFLITGVLGPHSNAHGPNEFLDIEYAKKLTGCVAYVIAKHCEVMSHA